MKAEMVCLLSFEMFSLQRAVNRNLGGGCGFRWLLAVGCTFGPGFSPAAQRQMDPRVTALETRKSNGVGEYCEMTIIPYKNSDHMRLALLGFLALAY